MSLYRDVIHDILLEIVDEPTPQMVETLYKNLPLEIKVCGRMWGWSDTIVKTDIFVFAKEFNWETA